MSETVILYGTNQYTRPLINWDADAEFWSWNEVGSLKDEEPEVLKQHLRLEDGERDESGIYWAKRLDLLLQIHVPPIWRNAKNVNHHGHYAWLQKPHPFPIYMQEVYPEVPASVKYPKEEIIRELIPNLQREVKQGEFEQVEHFTSSAAYVIALAIYMGKKRIELAGVEMTSDTEYVRQRDGVTFWLGVATGRDVEVVLHSPLLMKDRLYGYTGEIMIERQEFDMAVNALNKEVEKAKTLSFESKGISKGLVDALVQSILDKVTNANRKKYVEELVGDFLRAHDQTIDAAFDYGRLIGHLQANKDYLYQCDELIKAAGGERALAALMLSAEEK